MNHRQFLDLIHNEMRNDDNIDYVSLRLTLQQYIKNNIIEAELRKEYIDTLTIVTRVLNLLSVTDFIQNLIYVQEKNEYMISPTESREADLLEEFIKINLNKIGTLDVVKAAAKCKKILLEYLKLAKLRTEVYNIVTDEDPRKIDELYNRAIVVRSKLKHYGKSELVLIDEWIENVNNIKTEPYETTTFIDRNYSRNISLDEFVKNIGANDRINNLLNWYSEDSLKMRRDYSALKSDNELIQDINDGEAPNTDPTLKTKFDTMQTTFVCKNLDADKISKRQLKRNSN